MDLVSSPSKLHSLVVSRRRPFPQLHPAVQTTPPELDIPLWKHTLVKIHHDRVLLRDGPVEVAFHIAMRPQRLTDMPSSAIFCAELDRLEPKNVLYGD